MGINQNIYTHTAGRFSLPQYQMFGFVLILLGGYLLFILNWFGLIAIVVGVALFFAIVGIQIDFEKKLRREFLGLFGYKIGKWTSLPEIEYVTIFIENYAQRGSVVTIDSMNRFSKVKVSLIVSKTIKYDGGFFDSKEKALEAGKMIARNLNTKLLDYTTKEPKWISLNNTDTKF